MRVLAGLVLVSLAFSGCLTADEPSTPDSAVETAPEPAIDPVHIDETYDLFPSGMDESWDWTMSPNMTGRTTIEYIPDPAATGDASLCYELKWPQGRHSRCAIGSISISTDGGLLAKTTIYDVSLYPNSFHLHVWTGSGPDTAKAHVFVETHVA